MWGIVGPGPLGPIGTTPVGIITLIRLQHMALYKFDLID